MNVGEARVPAAGATGVIGSEHLMTVNAFAPAAPLRAGASLSAWTDAVRSVAQAHAQARATDAERVVRAKDGTPVLERRAK